MRLSADNRQLRGSLKAVPKTAVVLRHRAGHRQFGRRLRAQRADQRRHGDQGLARGQAAITGEGLVGRLTEVGDRAARVLLITDLNSRIPVVVEGAHANAVLAGDNSERPRLDLSVAAPDAVKIGDRVVTSGEGGVFPPGSAGRRGRGDRRRTGRGSSPSSNCRSSAM